MPTRDLVLTHRITSSFLSCEKDAETILRKLFIESRPYSDELKRLLVINTKDCLDDRTNPDYLKKLESMTLAKMMEDGYVKLAPKIRMPEHEEVKSYIIMTFDDFSTTKTNPKFRDCYVSFDVVCHTDYWDIGNYRVRPLKIVGYIDGLLNNIRLSGIGTFQFAGCNELVLDENLSGYTLMYHAVHGSDDQIPERDL
ncbi:MAG: hypothetical protein LUC37_02875 [Prevotella sp.]|nr:hypothetical protein [Prevotella sp.]